MKTITSIKSQSPFNIAIIVSMFNQEITQKLYDGAIQRLKELNFPEDKITVVWVPGAIEIPVTAQQLAKTNAYEAIVCLGAIIRGETSHYDHVCDQLSEGCQRVALDHEIPVIFGVLTTEDEQQALDRLGGKHGHKGRDAIDCAFHMASVFRQIR